MNTSIKPNSDGFIVSPWLMMSLLFAAPTVSRPRSICAKRCLQGRRRIAGCISRKNFPRFRPTKSRRSRKLPYHEIAFRVLSKFTDGIDPGRRTRGDVPRGLQFPVPLEIIHDRIFLMRLDQGPTASFKDFAAQMMARMFGRFLREDGQAGHDSHRDQRGHRLGGGARVSQDSRSARHRAVSDGGSQREPAQVDDHAQGQHPHGGD